MKLSMSLTLELPKNPDGSNNMKPGPVFEVIKNIGSLSYFTCFLIKNVIEVIIFIRYHCYKA